MVASLPVSLSLIFLTVVLTRALRIHRSHIRHEENNNHSNRQFRINDDESFSYLNLTSWTSQVPKRTQKVQVTTLDLNRAYKPYPEALPVSFTEHTSARTTLHKTNRKCVLNFCENVENYPEDLIKNAVSRSKLESYFKQTEVPFDLNNRGAFDDEEDASDTMCPVKSITLYPQSAKNTKNEERILVNVEGARQGIIFETCLKENDKCRYNAGFPDGYVATCKQKYIRRSLAVLDGEKSNTAWDTFEIPSCCVCVIKKE